MARGASRAAPARPPGPGHTCSSRLITTCLPGSDEGLGAARPRPIDPGRALDPSCPRGWRSEEHTSELQSLMRISYAVFCLQKKNTSLPLNRTTKPLHLSYY